MHDREAALCLSAGAGATIHVSRGHLIAQGLTLTPLLCCAGRPGLLPQANQILGLAPGEIFVQRNVGNQAMHTDMNLMACLEFAVKSLKVCFGVAPPV